MRTVDVIICHVHLVQGRDRNASWNPRNFGKKINIFVCSIAMILLLALALNSLLPLLPLLLLILLQQMRDRDASGFCCFLYSLNHVLIQLSRDDGSGPNHLTIRANMEICRLKRVRQLSTKTISMLLTYTLKGAHSVLDWNNHPRGSKFRRLEEIYPSREAHPTPTIIAWRRWLAQELDHRQR